VKEILDIFDYNYVVTLLLYDNVLDNIIILITTTIIKFILYLFNNNCFLLISNLVDIHIIIYIVTHAQI
jgi:hypothetical protein